MSVCAGWVRTSVWVCELALGSTLAGTIRHVAVVGVEVCVRAGVGVGPEGTTQHATLEWVCACVRCTRVWCVCVHGRGAHVCAVRVCS